MMVEYAVGEAKVHLEPQTETTPIAEPEVQGEEQNQVPKRNKQKRTDQSRAVKNKESEDDKAFIADEAYSFWRENLKDRGFIRERGFGKFVSSFVEIIEKGWSLFCMHKPPGFAVVVREFYANMVEMKEDLVYVRGIWVLMGHERINEVLQIKDPKNGSKYMKLLKEPNHEKIVNFLTAGKGKWSSTKKNPHESINRGSITEEAKALFYFIASIIIPTKHLSTIRE